MAGLLCPNTWQLGRRERGGLSGAEERKSEKEKWRMPVNGKGNGEREERLQGYYKKTTKKAKMRVSKTEPGNSSL